MPWRGLIFGDSVDWLVAVVSPVLYILFAILLGAKAWLGTPLHCIAPANFTQSWVAYAESACWARGSHMTKEYLRSSSHHWVTLYLLVSAFFLILPQLLHFRLNDNLGIRVVKLVHLLRECNEPQNMARTVCYGGYINSLLYLFCKWLQLLTLILEFAVLCDFMGVSGHYGWSLVNDLRSGVQFQDPDKLPLSMACPMDFKLGGSRRVFSLLCAVPANLMAARLLTILWFWLLLLMVWSAVELVRWHLFLFVPFFGQSYLSGFLLNGAVSVTASVAVWRKLAESLCADGLLLLGLVEWTLGDAAAHGLAQAIWTHFGRETKIETLIT